MALYRINRAYRNIRRIQEIINVLARHGFGQLIARLNLSEIMGVEKIALLLKKYKKPTVIYTIQERFRLVLEDLGPTFIKFGQLLSTRPDLIPKDFADELRKLTDQVPPFPYHSVETILSEQLGEDFKQKLSNFSSEPIASASIAQVHLAELDDGTKVVVKVQRPGIERLIESDIDILYYFASLIEKNINEIARFHPVGIVEEFAKAIRRELDFKIEGSNTERVRRNLQGYPYIKIPKVIWELTTGQVLVMERLEGFPIDDMAEIARRGYDRKLLAHIGAEAALTMILEHGVFHGDPHSGNLLILDQNTIGLIDFGIIGYLDRELKESIANIVVALIARDYDRLIQAFINLGLIDEEHNLRAIKRELMELIEPYHGMPLKVLEMGYLLQNILEVVSRYDADIPPDLYMLVRSLILIEGLGRQLDPEIDLVKIGTPFARRILTAKLDPRRALYESYKLATEATELIRLLPEQLRTLLRRAIKNQLRLEIRHGNLENLEQEISRAGGRMSVAIILGSMVIASSFLLVSGTGPKAWGVSLFGLIGYLFAAILGIWILFAILRSGKL